jgi:cell wall assembly regulator SMI1
MIEILLRQLLRLSMAGKATVIVIAIVVISGSAIAVNTAIPHRSTANFCKVYSQEKAKYIHATNSDNIGAGLGAVLSIPELFDELDKVAPDEIEPDVANIRDSLKRARDAAGSSADNPLAGLGSSLVAGLASAQSWQNVSSFVDQNCPKTPEEKAAIKAQADKATLDKAEIDLENAAIDITGSITARSGGASDSKPLGLTDQMDADLKTIRDDIAQKQTWAREATTTASDCKNLRETLTDGYNFLAADIRSVEEQGWPPAWVTSSDPTTLNPTTLGPKINKLKAEIDRYRQLGGDPTTIKPGSYDSIDEVLTEAQALLDRMTAEIEEAKTKTPDWYLIQLRTIYQQAHFGGACG